MKEEENREWEEWPKVLQCWPEKQAVFQARVRRRNVFTETDD
jgi:hypothetical protein